MAMNSINTVFKVIEYMNEHIEEELSLDEICTVSGCTKSHLCHIFKFYIGETPNKYFYQLKLKYGAKLLSKERNILDIAVKVGYGSHEAFSRAFKKEFGTTPSEYQKMYDEGLAGIDDLNDMELTLAFSASPSYRVFQGLDKYGKHYEVYQSLIKKGYIGVDDLEPTLKGKQITDKYYWDVSKIIIELSKEYNNLDDLYTNTNRIIYIPKLLFYNTIYDMVDIGLIKNLFIGSCGSNCFNCDALKATLTDDDDLRKSHSKNLQKDFNIEISYENINCLGCTSDTRLASCETNCSLYE